MTLTAIKETIRSNGYAWPGGYPVYFVTRDGSALSIAAARASWRDIVAAHLAGDVRSDWYITGALINWEDDNLYCDETGAKIESAYS